MVKTYYQTVPESPAVVAKSRQNAKRQEDEVLQLYKRHKRLSPSQVSESCRNWPVTSVRRAITNLTKRGLLTKTATTMLGPYGKSEHVWEVN